MHCWFICFTLFPWFTNLSNDASPCIALFFEMKTYPWHCFRYKTSFCFSGRGSFSLRYVKIGRTKNITCSINSFIPGLNEMLLHFEEKKLSLQSNFGSIFFWHVSHTWDLAPCRRACFEIWKHPAAGKLTHHPLCSWKMWKLSAVWRYTLTLHK